MPLSYLESSSLLRMYIHVIHTEGYNVWDTEKTPKPIRCGGNVDVTVISTT